MKAKQPHFGMDVDYEEILDCLDDYVVTCYPATIDGMDAVFSFFCPRCPELLVAGVEDMDKALLQFMGSIKREMEGYRDVWAVDL